MRINLTYRCIFLLLSCWFQATKAFSFDGRTTPSTSRFVPMRSRTSFALTTPKLCNFNGSSRRRMESLKIHRDDTYDRSTSSFPSKNDNINPALSTRRSTLQSIMISTIAAVAGNIASPQFSHAQDESSSPATTTRKPYAPLEALLPATRVRVLIDTAADAANELVQLEKKSSDPKRRDELISRLNELLLVPQDFQSKSQTAQPLPFSSSSGKWNEWSTARQSQTKQLFQIESIQPTIRAIELFEQSGERNQWERLRRQEKTREKSNTMRAAFNAYTSSLVFGESYEMTASLDERRRLIRQYNQLPDVTSVIRSDLDLRDLYRNQVLTVMDDARAEWVYRVKIYEGEVSDGGASGGGDLDATELLSLLKDARDACDKWFGFIAEKDVKEAMDVVRAEKDQPTN